MTQITMPSLLVRAIKRWKLTHDWNMMDEIRLSPKEISDHLNSVSEKPGDLVNRKIADFLGIHL